MYVIYPADELILMTYGLLAPRVKPRPTLDCLREPLIPLEYPARAATSSNVKGNANVNLISAAAAATSYPNDSYSTAQWSPSSSLATGVTRAQPIPSRIPTTLAAPTPSNSPQEQPQSPLFEAGGNNFFSFEPPLTAAQVPQSQSLPPTPTRRTSRASLTHSNHNSGGSKRSSVRSNRSQAPLSPRLLPHQRPLSTSMYNNDANMQGGGNSASGRAPFQRSGSAFDEEGRLIDYGAAASSALVTARSRSPSVFLEPPSPDPTHAHFGPGWGRPMSPMDLPPECSASSSVPSKSPTASKSRLRPKLHIPLGRLGRSTSSDTRERESNRLREDVHVHVENPVFSSENLRQNNFDAFFEAREPVIKLQPRTPHSATADGRGHSPPLENYAGVYGTPRTRTTAGGTGGGGLFARLSREERERALSARSRSAEHWDEAGGAAPAPGGAAPASAGGGAAHSKGDRCPQKNYSFTS